MIRFDLFELFSEKLAFFLIDEPHDGRSLPGGDATEDGPYQTEVADMKVYGNVDALQKIMGQGDDLGLGVGLLAPNKLHAQLPELPETAPLRPLVPETVAEVV